MRPSARASSWCLLLSSAASVFADTCFNPDGSKPSGSLYSDTYVVCNRTSNTGHCCAMRDMCLTNGLCKDPDNTNVNWYGRDACSESNWGPECPQYCDTSATGNRAGSWLVFKCSESIYCCSYPLDLDDYPLTNGQHTNNASCCDDPTRVFNAGPAVRLSGPQLALDDFTAASSLSSSSSSSKKASISASTTAAHSPATSSATLSASTTAELHTPAVNPASLNTESTAATATQIQDETDPSPNTNNDKTTTLPLAPPPLGLSLGLGIPLLLLLSGLATLFLSRRRRRRNRHVATGDAASDPHRGGSASSADSAPYKWPYVAEAPVPGGRAMPQEVDGCGSARVELADCLVAEMEGDGLKVGGGGGGGKGAAANRNRRVRVMGM